MYSHIKLGAINTRTGKYERVLSASKNDKYICPICKKDVLFAQGLINKSHFKHASNSKCSHYNGGESALHYNGKRLLKDMLENKTVEIHHECLKCKETESFEIPNNTINNVIIEYRFIYDERQRSADVALLNKNGNPIAMFEVVYTHKTKENDRPEPWFEISAVEINELDINNNNYVLNCERRYFCDECKEQNAIEYKNQQEIYRVAREEQMERDRIARESQRERDRIIQETNLFIKNKIIHSKTYKIILIDLKEKVVRIAREKQIERDRIAREKQIERNKIAREEQMERNRIALEEQMERDRIKKLQLETTLKTRIQTENIIISNECGQCKNIVITGNIKKSINNKIKFDYCKYYVDTLENIKVITQFSKIYNFDNYYIKQLLQSNSIITKKICDICNTTNKNTDYKERDRRGILTDLDKLRFESERVRQSEIDRLTKINKPTIKKNNKQLQVSKYAKK